MKKANTYLSQNSFMKQLLWAMNKTGSVEEIALIDATSLIPDPKEQKL